MAADPHNVVRLILPRHPAGQPGSPYTDAARDLSGWLLSRHGSYVALMSTNCFVRADSMAASITAIFAIPRSPEITGFWPVRIASETCSICGKPAEERFRPFCSRRCADVDLNRWLSGVYAVLVSEDEEEDERRSEGGAAEG